MICKILLTLSSIILRLQFDFFFVLNNGTFACAAGIIAILDEPMPELKVFALKKLDSIVDEFWPEISESIEKM